MRKFLISIISAASGVAVFVALTAFPPEVARSAAAEKPPGGGDPRGGRSGRPPEGSTTRPGPRPGPGGMSRRFGKPLTKEQEEEVLKYLESKRPDLYKQAVSQREKDPWRYQRTIRSMWHFISLLKSLPKPVAEAMELRHRLQLQMWLLAKELKDTKDSGQQKKLKKQIQDLADKYFDADQTIRQHRLSQLEEYMARLKRELAERVKDRRTVVQETVERMISDAERRDERNEDGPGPRPPSPPPGRGESFRPKPPGD